MSSGRTGTEDSIILVHAYLDGELSVSESVEAERAIAASQELAAEAAAVRALKSALQTRLPQEALPPQFAARIAARVGLHRPAPRPSWMLLAAAVVLAMVLSSALTTVVFRNMGRGVDGIYAASVDSHLRALMASRPVEVASIERHIVKPWFNGKSVQSPKVADLAKDGFPLVGARVDVVQGTPVPAIVYNRRLHVISVWAATEALAAHLTKPTHSVNGTNIVVWRAGDMVYWAASDLNAAELSTFAELFAAAS